MRPKAVFDVGSNSVKLLLAGVEAGRLKVIRDEVRICGLGEGLGRSGLLGEEAMGRALDALSDLARMAEDAGAEQTVAVGTEALRAAANAALFAERLFDRTGLRLRIIRGEEEARLSFLAATAGVPEVSGEIVTFDVGGGSTEFNFGSDGAVRRSFSLPIGCIPLTEEFLRKDPPTPEQLAALYGRLDELLSGLPRSDGTLLGIGGTVTTLGSVQLRMERFSGERVRGLRVTIEEVERQAELYRSLPLRRRRAVSGLHPDRAPVILAGTAIVRSVMGRCGFSELRLSGMALRHGLFVDRWLC